MYKTEMHLHTREISPCGHLKATEMVKRYYEAGYSTLVITDHLKPVTIEALGDALTWEEKITVFFSSYHRAKVMGDKLGMQILYGAELGIAENPNHYLLYGASMEFYKSHPNFLNLPIAEIRELVKREPCAMMIQAHPFRDEKNFPTPDYVDGMEINSSPRHRDFSDQTKAVAMEHGLPVIGGSDAHRLEDIGRGGIMTETKITSSEELIRLVLERKFTPIWTPAAE